MIDATDGSKKISLTPAAMKARAAKTSELEHARLYLTARYD